ncbi:hypothetical protein L7F22_011743 [Adiantum nelumboides]|nr:hypothetical protein [Adiantum nelumboides]
MEESHVPPYAGHRDIDATVKAGETFFYWPTLRRDVDAFVRECIICQTAKIDRQKAPGLLHPLRIPDKPWESIAMDFIFDLPRTQTGNDGIWTIICRFSKEAHFIRARKKIKPDQIARLFMSNIFKYHGMPQSIVSDRDPRMTMHKGKWEQYLPLVEYAYNNTVQSSTGKAPFEIVEGGKKVPPILHTKDKIFEAGKYVQDMDEMCYSFATEEDMKRWERSYEKLRPAHKELLPHLPKKYQDLRRCSAANFRFILNMLQVFDSPFDMSQEYDTGEEDTIKQARKFSFGSNSACPNGTCDEIHAHSPVEASDRATNGQLCSPDRKGIASPRERDAQLDGAVQNGQCSGGLCGKDSRCIENRLKGGKARLEDVNKIAKTERSFSKIKKISVCGMNFQDPSLQLHVPPADVDKVRCIIRNIVRDWTKEGALERDQCYKPILEELNYYFPNRSKERPPCCVVPGAGLARLACEISCLGFACQGNEFSYYMLICSSFILNNTEAPLEWVIYPWIHSNCNMTSDENQLQPVYFPDLHPGSAGITDGFSMCAGDFVEVYSHSGQEGMWDAVVTCFFIDTAHNIVEYIEIIAKILKPGGVWINLGPLLYHFADAVSFSGEEEMSLEISLEDVKKVALSYGLKLQKERTIETTYTANQKSMIQTRYTAAFWTMIKDGDMQTAQQ